MTYTNAGKALVRRDPSLAAVVAEIEVDAAAPYREALEDLMNAAAAIESWYETGDEALRRVAVKPLIGAMTDARGALRREPAEVAR